MSNLCVEPEPGAREITRGITEELILAGLDSSIAVTGSTEKNIPTRQTGLILAIGVARAGSLKLGLARPNDRLFCVGLPKVGNEVDLDDPEIATLRPVMALRACPEVHEIVPVGSQGIRREAEVLAQTAGMELYLDQQPAWIWRNLQGLLHALFLLLSPVYLRSKDLWFSPCEQ